MTWLALLITATVFLAPLAGLFSQIGAETFHDVVTSSSFAKVIGVTLFSGATGALISVAAAVFFARQFALHEWRGKRLQRLGLLLPYLVPNFILATAYVVSWNPATGVLNPLFHFPGGLYGLTGMTLLFAVVHMPVAFLLLEEKFRRIDSSLREAARLSGAGSVEILRKIELPLLLPTLLSAYVLCFALDISAFAIPAWIGAPEHVYPLTYKIYQAIQVEGQDGIPKAASFSILLFVFVVPLLLGAAWVQRDEKKFATLSGKAARRTEGRQRGRSVALFQGVYWSTQLVLWILPLSALFLSTIVKPGCLQQSGLICLNEVSMRSYHYVIFELAETSVAFQGSLIYGSLSALLILASCLGALAALSRAPIRLKIAEWIFAVPVATPGAIIALGLIVTCSGRFGLNLYNTPWIVVVAFVLKHMNLAFQPLRTGLTNISSSLLEAARLSGARSGQVWARIVIPILQPELMGGFFLVLIPILGELTMSIFLVSPRFRSIGTVLFDLQDYADQASAAALSVLLVILILLVNEMARLLSKGRFGY